MCKKFVYEYIIHKWPLTENTLFGFGFIPYPLEKDKLNRLLGRCDFSISRDIPEAHIAQVCQGMCAYLASSPSSLPSRPAKVCVCVARTTFFRV